MPRSYVHRHFVFALVVVAALPVWLCRHASAADPSPALACPIFLCMAGKVQHGGAESGVCGKLAAAYFSIKKPDGGFEGTATHKARATYLSQCQATKEAQNFDLFNDIDRIYGYVPFDPDVTAL